MNDMDVRECPVCRRKVICVATERGQVIPLIPSPVGNVFFRRGRAVYVSEKEKPVRNAALYLPHSTMCYGTIN